MRKTSIDRLQPGIFISLADLGWINHPFMFSEFCIKDAAQIATLKALGLTAIEYDPARSTAPLLPEQDAAPAPVEDPATKAATAALLQQKKIRIERVRERRETFARREREYEKEALAAGEILKAIGARPNEMHAQAKALVTRVVTHLIGAESDVIQLVNSKGKDANAAFHALNVMALSLMLGRALQLNEEELRLLGLGALLHDLGKAEIPARILRSTARTPPEEDFYRAHVGYGIKATAGIRDLPPTVKQIIACHHEQMDGQGFPNRLPGDKIPKLARLVAIANRYDNLCNPFDLRLAMTPAEAVSHLFKHEAKHFQAEALQAFVKTLGVYPPGSFVQLSNGLTALVVEVNSTELLRPIVMLHDPDIPRAEALLLDLREADLNIVAAVSPAKLPVETVEYLAPRGRIDYYVDAAG